MLCAVVIECNECANRTSGGWCAKSLLSHIVLIFVFFFLVAVMLCIRCILFLISLPLSSLPSFTRFIYSRARDGWRTNRSAVVNCFNPFAVDFNTQAAGKDKSAGQQELGAHLPAPIHTGFLHVCVQDHRQMNRTKLVAPELCAHAN